MTPNVDSRDESSVTRPTATELLPQHRALVVGSAIAPEVAADRGYRSVTKKTELRVLGFSDNQCRVPALLIPVFGVHGEVVTYQARPDTSRVVNGKATKYETPKASHMALDVPRRCLSKGWLGDPKRPLIITEGARKADAAVSQDLCTIALLGVWNWRGTNDLGGKVALPDWESIALNERDVYICFDSDVVTKPAVRMALRRLKAFLESRHAHVHTIYLPPADGGAKVGLDDFFAAGGSIAQLLALVGDKQEPSDGEVTAELTRGPYFERDGKTYCIKHTREGDIDEQLANFTARIVGSVVEDDGVEPRTVLRIAARLGPRAKEFDVAGERFESIRWATEQLGPKATVSAGFGSRDRLREAIQTLSPDEIPERRVYTHMGWREIDGQSVYLHAGGAIGQSGVVPGVETRLEPPLDRFSLPVPPEGADLVRAVQESVALLDGLAPDRVMFPLFSIPWTTVIGVETNFSLHLAGTTGCGKTELAALIQRHFGATMDAGHLPASWSSTANALEGVAFLAKDAVLVVDDFKPVGSENDVARLHRDADRVLRAQGNLSGRGRMRSDGSLRPPRPPRGVIVSTGEDVPVGQSLRARLIVLDVSEGDVRFERLTVRQAAGDQYCVAMAGFVKWLASSRLDVTAVRTEIATCRDAFRIGLSHNRAATIGATLVVGLRVFLRFAREIGAISESEVDALLARARPAMWETLRAQNLHQHAANPVPLFFELIAQALQSGTAHVRDVATEQQPEGIEGVAGWRRVQSETANSMGASTHSEWRPGGDCIGWVDVNTSSVYLLPQPALRAAQRAAGDAVHRIPVTARMLWKAIAEAGHFVSADEGRHTKKIRIGKKTLNALHIALGQLVGDPGTSGTLASDGVGDAVAGIVFPETVPDPTVGGEVSGTSIGNGNPFEIDADSSVPHVDCLVPDVPDSRGEQTNGRAHKCHACGAVRFWRLHATAPWVCVECAPPGAAKLTYEYCEIGGVS